MEKIYLRKEFQNRINILFFSYLIFTLACLVVDYFELFKFYKPKTILSSSELFQNLVVIPDVLFIFIILLSFTLIFFLFKKNKLELIFKNFFCLPEIHKFDWFFLLVIFSVTMIRLPIPENSWDSIHYHLFLQDFQFENNVLKNYFPAYFHTFTFPLGDRLFFVFRTLLGYRAGTILNTLITILIFFQIKEILILVFEFNFQKNYQKFVLSFAAFFVISSEYLLGNIGNYMIDILMIPFLLELFKIAFGSKKLSKTNFVLGSLYFGLSVSIKLTSLLFGFLLMLIVIIKNLKISNLRLLLLTIFLFIIPIIPYAFYNFTQTGNPIYPYFNELFSSAVYGDSLFSPYFNSSPQNFLETLYWPLIIFFKPEMGSQIPFYSGRISFGYLVLLISLVFIVIRKNNKFLNFNLYLLTITYLWADTLFSTRYAIFLEILFGFLLIYFAKKILKKYLIYSETNNLLEIKFSASRFETKKSFTFLVDKKNIHFIRERVLLNKFLTTSSIIFIFLIGLQLIYSMHLYLFLNKIDWSSRGQIAFQNPGAYFQNLGKVGKDHKIFSENEEMRINEIINDIDFWMVGFNFTPITGYARLIKPEIPIIYYSYKNINLHTKNIYNEYFLPNLSNKKNVFTLSREPIDPLLITLQNEEIEVINNYEIYPNFTLDPIYLLQININK
jgi:hypothetical protein